MSLQLEFKCVCLNLYTYFLLACGSNTLPCLIGLAGGSSLTLIIVLNKKPVTPSDYFHKVFAEAHT